MRLFSGGLICGSVIAVSAFTTFQPQNSGNLHMKHPSRGSIGTDNVRVTTRSMRMDSSTPFGRVTRRGLLPNLARTLLVPSLLSMAMSQPALASDAKTILMTGTSSGLGLDAATKLAAMGHRVYVACRTKEKAEQTAAKVGASGAFVCDLSSLASIKSFAKEWGAEPIDVLCLNAGMAPGTKSTIKRTPEGFEECVGTNHLGHFLLASLLLKRLEDSKNSNPRVVITASSVHDPDTPGGDVGAKATLGDLSGLEACAAGSGTFDMVDGGAYDGDKAYKDSKLCNVLFTKELDRRLQSSGSKVRANCFSPGLITSTGLFRNQNPIFVKVFDFAATRVIGVAASISQGGDALVTMATDPSLTGKGGLFFATAPGKPSSGFEPRESSKESQDTQKAKRLWELSEKLVA